MSRNDRPPLAAPRHGCCARPCRRRVEMESVLGEAGAQKSGCRVARTLEDAAVGDPDRAGRTAEEGTMRQPHERPHRGRLLRPQLQDELGFVTDMSELVRDERPAENLEALTAGY